jgi:hypothetical protein
MFTVFVTNKVLSGFVVFDKSILWILKMIILSPYVIFCKIKTLQFVFLGIEFFSQWSGIFIYLFLWAFFHLSRRYFSGKISEHYPFFPIRTQDKMLTIVLLFSYKFFLRILQLKICGVNNVVVHEFFFCPLI